MQATVPGWNGEPIEIAYSHGGVPAVLDVRDNLIWDVASGFGFAAWVGLIK